MKFYFPVDIEVPYIPFSYETYPFVPNGDDGRVPSLFKSIANLLAPPKQEEPIPEEIEVNPRFLTFGKQPNLVGFLSPFLVAQRYSQTETLSF